MLVGDGELDELGKGVEIPPDKTVTSLRADYMQLLNS